MNIETISVVGAGTMGAGIAQVCVEAGYKILLIDIEQKACEAGLEKIHYYLNKKEQKGLLSSEVVRQAKKNIKISTLLEESKETDFVIEAASEDTGVKQNIFKKLDDFCDSKTILASNTSTISITKIASATKNPARVIGMHYFVPAPIMQLVEVIKGLKTDEEVFTTTMDLAQALNKSPVPAPDSPGFTVNRIFVPMWNEAMFLVMEGEKPEDIDQAMKLGGNLPMGPLQLADYAGLDIVLDTMEELHRSIGDPKYRPCPLLRKMVTAGDLGRKSKRGFYDY